MAIGFSTLGSSVTGLAPGALDGLGAGTGGTASGAVARFEAALERAGQPETGLNTGEIRVAQSTVGGATRTDGVQPAQNASQDVLKSLDLDKTARPAEVPSTGDLILGGLKKLRGMFDAQNTSITEMINRPMGDSKSLLAMQVEVVKYSLLIDVASKLTGKSTQSFDTLMKGQ